MYIKYCSVIVEHLTMKEFIMNTQMFFKNSFLNSWYQIRWREIHLIYDPLLVVPIINFSTIYNLRRAAMAVWVVSWFTTLFKKVNRSYAGFIQVCMNSSIRLKKAKKEGEQRGEPSVQFWDQCRAVSKLKIN